ncbi:hypothetical protein GEMRC1_006814 [Eukaryota sp. GEM-RC1]
MKSSLLTITLLSLVAFVCADIYEVRHHNFYKTLNVPRDATGTEIKKAFRTIVRTQHPDKAETTEDRIKAEKMFPLFNEAYEILSDAELRRELDYLLEERTLFWYTVTGKPVDGRYGIVALSGLVFIVLGLSKHLRYLLKKRQRSKMNVEMERKRHLFLKGLTR